MPTYLTDLVDTQEGPMYDLRPKLSLVIDISKVGEILSTAEGVLYYLQKVKVVKQFKDPSTKEDFFNFVLKAKIKHAKNSAVAIEQSEFLETYTSDLSNRVLGPLSTTVNTINTLMTTAIKEANSEHRHQLDVFLSEFRRDAKFQLSSTLGETKTTLDSLSAKVEILNEFMDKPIKLYVEE